MNVFVSGPLLTQAGGKVGGSQEPSSLHRAVNRCSCLTSAVNPRWQWSTNWSGNLKSEPLSGTAYAPAGSGYGLHVTPWHSVQAPSASSTHSYPFGQTPSRGG